MSTCSPYSILMSVYRNETSENLQQSLESLFMQKMKPDEIVIVIDGPVSDDILQTINYWSSHMNIVIHRLEHNVGLGLALHSGIKLCKHELIARMDTDDVSMPERFDVQIRYMIDNPDVAILGSNVQEYDKNLHNFIGYRYVPLAYAEIVSFAKKRNPFNHMSVVFRKSIILASGNYQNHKLMEDYNLWLRVIAAGHKVENLSNILLKVRVDENSIARRKGGQYILSELKLAKLKYTLGIQKGIPLLSTLALRCIPRMLPGFMLSMLYKLNRRTTLRG